MSTQQHTMSISPAFAGFMQTVVENAAREAAYAEARASVPTGALRMLLGTTPEEAVDTFLNATLTLVVGQTLLDAGMENVSITDYEVAVVPRGWSDRVKTLLHALSKAYGDGDSEVIGAIRADAEALLEGVVA